MKYLSLFSGIGGFEKGIMNASDDFECIGYSEINKYASAIYNYNFPNHKNYGNITAINESELPDFDLLVGGFPCQSFSIAGKRQGFEDTRGTLFFDVARILSAKRPEWLILENVKGLLNHDAGKTIARIFGVLAELGYSIGWEVVNSSNFGVPQNRERIYIIGNLGAAGADIQKILPIKESIGESGNKISVAGDTNKGGERGVIYDPAGIMGALTSTDYKQPKQILIGTWRTHKDGNGFRENEAGICPAIPARAREDGSGQPVIKIKEATKKGYAIAEKGDAINLSVPGSETRRGRVSKLAHTLDTGANQYTLQDKIRRLTPKECERLQGFPDDWTKYGRIDGKKVLISDTQRYKTTGNAVTVNVVEAIIKKIKV